MFSFVIRAGASFTSGWPTYWFTHGLSVIDISLVEENLTAVFIPKARVVTVAGDRIKTDG